jgi:nucleoside phosphorylase
VEQDGRIFRRLRLSDKDALETLCNLDRRWLYHFPQHERWWQRAVKQLGSEGRAAFGVFSLLPNPYGPSSQRLDAAIFLKASELNDSAELKNLVLRDEGTGQKLSDSSYTACTGLIEKAIRFCEMRDIATLEIELPQSEHTFISLFLRQGFRILSQRERYFPGRSVCTLEKRIGETYHGDPFNYVQLGTWLLHAILPCKVSRWENFEDKDEVLLYLPFEIFPSHPAFSEGNSTGFSRRMRGGLFILDESDCTSKYFERLERLTFPEGNHVQYLMADRLPAHDRKRLEARGFICFDRNEIIDIAGGGDSSLSIPMGKLDISGVATVLEEELVRSYAELKQPFIYFLLGGIGGALEVTSSEDSENPGAMLAVHCPSWSEGREGIVAIADINKKKGVSIKDAYDCFPKNIPRALSKEDLEFYITREDGANEVFALLCSELKILRNPLTFGDPIWSNHKEMHDYLSKDLRSVNSAYLNEDICEVLRGLDYDSAPGPAVSSGRKQEGHSAPTDAGARSNTKQKEHARLADIVVIVIREDEQRAVLSRLVNARPLKGHRGAYTIGDVPASSSGEVYRVAVARTTEQGPGEAQFAAQSAIEDLDPQWLAVVGIAGAVPDNEFTLGDVVVASRIHDFSVSAAVETARGHRREFANQGGPMMRIIGSLIGIVPAILDSAPDWNHERNIAAARPNMGYSGTDLYGSENWKRRTKESLSQPPRSAPLVTSRAVASSGTLVKDTELFQDFLRHSRDVAHVEMELAGVYHAANTLQRFYPILAVRGISDIVGLKRHSSWTEYACNTAATFFFTLLRHMPEDFLESRQRGLEANS